ncbi:ComEC family competence protein [Lacrimispora amygdalina]|uniref:ComEC family competence protein n=1 Tax=Lacrimispora amygdalina TaxID=253257 RepID=A0A3E2NEU8_9FIRM|nr:ComEC/Rec2 family competence protein [Clostridium indicum]RFZ79483.1 ComEC family competence protein [Clostridium indicum]
MLALTSWLFLPAFIAAGMIFCVCRRGRNPLWVFLPLVFFYLGSARAGSEMEKWREREKRLYEISSHYTQVQGKISFIEEEEGAVLLTLKNNRIRKMTKGNWDEVPYEHSKILVSLKEAGSVSSEQLGIGQTVMVRGEVQLFSQARNPGEFDFKDYYQSLGLDFRLFAEEMEIVDAAKSPLLERLRKFKLRSKELLYRDAKEEDAGIFAAAVLGDRKGISSEIKDLYQKNGIAHLLAISGLHMSFIGLAFYKLMKKAGAGFWEAGLLSTALLILYGIMTGGGPSVVRAGFMMCVGFYAACLGRTYDLLSAASLSLLLLSFHSPFLIMQGGVQLSFGAVFAIGGLAPVIRGWLGKDHLFAGSISACFAVQMMTLPVTAFHFYQMPPYGLVLNLLVIPLMGGVLCSGMGVIAFGAINSVLGTAAAGTGHYILSLYEVLLKTAGQIPGHNIILGRPDILVLAAYALLLTAGMLFIKMLGKWENGEKKEADLPKERKDKNAGRIPYGGKLLFLAGFYLLSILLFLPKPVRGLDAWFLDVGQGDGILLRTEGEAILVDGGSSSNKSLGEYTLSPCLKSLGISEIDYAFVSHGDQDHLSGVKYLLESCEDIQIKNLFLPYHGREDESIQSLKELGSKRGTCVRYLTGGDFMKIGTLSITCLYPGKEDVPGDVNGESQVLKMDYGDCHMLFTGDMGEAEEQRLLGKTDYHFLGEVNVLKTAHHGSRFSSSEPFLDAVSPAWAVISYGQGNSYGHPHKEVLDRLKERNVTVFQTGKSGAVRLETDGTRIRFSTFVDGNQNHGYNEGKEKE